MSGILAGLLMFLCRLCCKFFLFQFFARDEV